MLIVTAKFIWQVQCLFRISQINPDSHTGQVLAITFSRFYPVHSTKEKINAYSASFPLLISCPINCQFLEENRRDDWQKGS